MFEGFTVTVADTRYDYEEDRFISFGILDGHVVAVAHTECDEVIRIISMRRATRNEEEYYFEKIPPSQDD